MGSPQVHLSPVLQQLWALTLVFFVHLSFLVESEMKGKHPSHDLL